MNKDCFTPKVLEADCDNTPITFLTTEIEGVDDTVNPPLNGAYKNTIVKYLMTGHVYLYNSVGVPVLLNESSVVDDELSLDSTNPVQNKVITAALNAEAEARETKDNELQQSIENTEDSLTTALETETANRENADNALQQQIENVDDNLSTALDNKVDKVTGKSLSTNDYTDTDKDIVEGLEGKLDQDVLNSIQISSNTSTDVLVLEDGKVNLWTGETNTHEVPLPVASPTSAGVMNAATYNAVSENSNKITNILQSTVAITGLPTTPTQDELTEQWKTASGETDLINGARIYDVTNHVNWTYYTNANEWLSVGAGGESISVNTWTNNSAGIVKGSTEDGQLFAEADGTGSVNGWDTVKSDIANNTSDIATLNTTVSGNTASINSLNTSVSTLTTDVANNTASIGTLNTNISGKQDTLVSGTNIKRINNNSLLGSGNIAVQPTLVSGTNIKTVNGSSILGSGDLTVTGKTEEIIATCTLGATTNNKTPITRITFTSSQVTSVYAGLRIPFKVQPSGSSYLFANSSTQITIGTTTLPLYLSNPYVYNSNQSTFEVPERELPILRAQTYEIEIASLPTVGGVIAVLSPFQNRKSQNVYSTTEQAIGTWIDGKTVYRKVYAFTITTINSEVTIDISGTNIEEVVSISGGMFSSGKEYYPAQYSNPAAPNIQSFQVKSNYGKNQLNYYAGATGTGRIILEYTKSN